MSGSLPTGPLSEAERVSARRFMGYPAFGAPPSGNQGWRFFQAYGNMEFRLTNLSEQELTVVRQYLTQLSELEVAILGSSENLDTDQAAVWVRNKKEVQDRSRLFDDWRRRLCGFFGLQPGPALSGQNSGRIII